MKVANVIARSCENKLKVSVASDQRSTQPTEGITNEDPAISASSDVVENDDNANKDGNVADDSVSKTRSARDVVTPLAHMSYNDQLEHKKSSLIQILKRLVRFMHLVIFIYFSSTFATCLVVLPLPVDFI